MSLKILDTCSQNLIPYFAHNHCVLLCVWVSFQGNLQKESLEMKKKKTKRKHDRFKNWISRVLPLHYTVQKYIIPSFDSKAGGGVLE